MLRGMSTGPLLIIWHSRTGTSEQLAAAACEGAGEGAQLLRACDTAPDDLLAAGGYLFCCPENLASMSGEMKEMFDRCYYPVLGRIEGRPYATVIAAGSDGEGAQRQLDRIATGWPQCVRSSPSSRGRLNRVFDEGAERARSFLDRFGAIRLLRTTPSTPVPHNAKKHQK